MVPFVEAVRVLLQTDCAGKAGAAGFYNLGSASHWLQSAPTVAPHSARSPLADLNVLQASEKHIIATHIQHENNKNIF